jgi:hypothetical protein
MAGKIIKIPHDFAPHDFAKSLILTRGESTRTSPMIRGRESECKLPRTFYRKKLAPLAR